MAWTTIIADASYCPDTHVGGYAFWIASDRGKRGGDGMFKSRPVNNIAAEMMAILNGLHDAVKWGLVQDGDGVLLQTDCQPAIDAFNQFRKNQTDQEETLAKWYLDFCVTRRLNVELRHVKGHTNRKEARFASNNSCDRKARANMRKARGMHHLSKIKESLQ